MKTCPGCMRPLTDSNTVCTACGTSLAGGVAQLCPSGKHRIDAADSECPYCRNDARSVSGPPAPRSARQPTMLEAQPGVRLEASPGSRPAPPPGEFRPGPSLSPPASGRRGVTVFSPTPPQELPPAGQLPSPAKTRAAARKVVGILITYSWKPEGQVFPVCEGRNLIGLAEEADIRVIDDPALSGINTHITFRHSFVVGDMVSMSGTDLNGEPVEEQFRPLPNYSKLRTGTTLWTFVMIDPPNG